MSTNKLRINKTFLKRKRSSIKSKELDVEILEIQTKLKEMLQK